MEGRQLLAALDIWGLMWNIGLWVHDLEFKSQLLILLLAVQPQASCLSLCSLCPSVDEMLPLES